MSNANITLPPKLKLTDGDTNTVRTIEADGKAADIDISIKPKGAGKLKLDAAAYVVASNKVLIINSASEVVAQFEVTEQQVAVPITLTDSGTPGTWAADASYFYFCIGANTWLKMRTESAALVNMEVYVAIPATPTSTGNAGQRAYDSTNSLMYECVAPNTWIRYTITTTW